jgi:hypothetical protein
VLHVEPPAEKDNDAVDAATDAVPPVLDIASPFPDLASPVATEEQRRQMTEDKELYHALQNLEDHPGEYPQGDYGRADAVLICRSR